MNPTLRFRGWSIAKLAFLLAPLAGLFSAASPIRAQQPPRFKVDAAWPLELPNNQIMGQVGGLAVDSHDHIWVLQRPGTDTPDELGAAQTPQRSLCCFTAKPVLEFDASGKLLNAWGGPGQGYDWPKSEHGIHVDGNDNVWVGGNSPADRMVLKFTREGRFLMQIGKPSTDPMDSSRTDILGRPAGIDVDESAHEVYIADGYGNKRVIIFDSETGAFKRLWGAYGNKPSDTDAGPYAPPSKTDAPAQQFRNPVHCVHIAHDGLVYVCDRVNNRIQVFSRQGKFVKEFSVRPETLAAGSAWDLAFSRDKAQSFLFVADGEDNVIWTLQRGDGKILGTTGHNGRNAGQFHWIHQIASDSAGNLYTGEVDSGKRIQRFVIAKK
jgi:hypothetical protein